MELLDRYLEAVRRNLPWRRQDDIVAELRANLEAQLEDKESALGRPPTREEAEAWVKQLGSPLQMAARYQSQQHLIGPELFPIREHIVQQHRIGHGAGVCLGCLGPACARTQAAGLRLEVRWHAATHRPV